MKPDEPIEASLSAFDDVNNRTNGGALSTHRLERVASMLWWQVPCGKATASCKNLALQQVACSLIMLPIWALVGWDYNFNQVHDDPGMSVTHFALLAIIPWLSVLSLFLFIARRHLQHVTEVRVSSEHLELSSAFRTRKVTWREIKDLYPVTNPDRDTVDAFVLERSNGEQFILSVRLGNFNDLIEEIRERMIESESIFHKNYRAEDGIFDGAIIASFAIVLACAVPVFSSFDFVAIDISAVAIVFGLLSVAAAFVWVHLARIPQIVRMGSNGVYLQTRTEKVFLCGDEIMRTKKVGPLYLIHTSRGCFLAAIDFATRLDRSVDPIEPSGQSKECPVKRVPGEQSS